MRKLGSGEIAQWAKTPATNLPGAYLIPRTQWME